MGNSQRTAQAGRRELRSATAGRIDAVIAEACPDLSRARVQRLIEGGFVTRNGAPVVKSTQVEPGDLLAVDIPLVEHRAIAPTFALWVLYEDGELLAIDKPAGLAVHGGPADTAPSVAAWFLARYPTEAAAFTAERPGIVHRLDKDTTGVLLLAKIPAAQASLSSAFERRSTSKAYLAVCDGLPARPRAVIDAPIGRHPTVRTRMAIVQRGRAARTEYEVLAQDKDRSLLLVRPETGRTHQIRVHLAGIGAPVAGDAVYGKAGSTRQLLHAWQLRVPHPAGGLLTVTAPIPADFEQAVRAIGAETLALHYAELVPPNRESPIVDRQS